MKSINVWDLPTRIFHWALAAAVILALIITDHDGPLYTIHALLGITALMLALFRLAWGFVGGEHARFRDFVAGWSAVREHVAGLLRLAPPRHIGHNALGGWAVLLLLALTLATAGTGILTGGLLDTATARAVRHLHEAFGSLLQLMVFIHIAGVVIDRILTRENIIAAMWHGRKQVEAASAAVDARGGSVLLAAAIAVPLIVLGGFVATQVDLTAAPGRHFGHESERD